MANDMNGKRPQSTLVVAIGSALVRDVIREASTHIPNLRVVGEAQDWKQLQAVLQHQEPKILLVSATLPGTTSPQALGALTRGIRDTKLVPIVRTDTPPEQAAALAALQPRAMVTTETHMADLIRVLELVMQGMTVFPAGIARQRDVASESLGASSDVRLSRREQELLQLLAQGCSEKEAATLLGIGQRTIHTYLDRIKRKLGASNRVHAVAVATLAGLVSPARQHRMAERVEA